MSVARAVSIEDLRQLAQRRLPRVVYDYIEGGCEDEDCLARICDAFRDELLVPRYLVDVSEPRQACALFGESYASPFGIAPTGMIALAHPKGDLVLAEAAARTDIPFVLSGASTASTEAVMKVNPKAWFQLYVPRDPKITADLVRRAADAGCKVLVLTVDVPVPSKRERNIKSGFIRPYRITLPMMVEAALHPHWLWGYLASGGLPRLENLVAYADKGTSARALASFYAVQIPSPVTWETLAQLRAQWRGKLVVKGIMHPDDALTAVRLGADGIIVSNHGGRQLDRSPAPIQVFPAIKAAVGGRTTMMLDSGIRRGADIVAALCHGAQFTFVGRATSYGLAAGGGEGVARAIAILRNEIDITLAQIGCPAVSELSPAFLHGSNRSGVSRAAAAAQ